MAITLPKHSSCDTTQLNSLLRRKRIGCNLAVNEQYTLFCVLSFMWFSFNITFYLFAQEKKTLAALPWEPVEHYRSLSLRILHGHFRVDPPLFSFCGKIKSFVTLWSPFQPRLQQRSTFWPLVISQADGSAEPCSCSFCTLKSSPPRPAAVRHCCTRPFAFLADPRQLDWVQTLGNGAREPAARPRCPWPPQGLAAGLGMGVTAWGQRGRRTPPHATPQPKSSHPV